MIEIEKYSIHEIIKKYPEIYCSVFNEFNFQGNTPSEVYIVNEDNKYIGFVAGYIQSTNTWYLQRGGLVSEERRKYLNLYRLKTLLDKIHLDWLYIMTIVNTEDLSALKISLASGFRIMGIRTDTSKNLWVEMIHKREGDIK